MKIITLTKPVYDMKTGATNDEKFFVNSEFISEILPMEAIFGKEDSNVNTIIIMNNGNQYKVLEKFDRVIELIAVS